MSVPTDEPHFERARFQKAAGTSFAVRLPGERSVPLTLLGVEASPARPGWESYSLLFEGPSGVVFDHGTYVVDHDDLGSFPLSVGPVHTDGPGQHYEAVFNHRAQAVPTNERTNHE